MKILLLNQAFYPDLAATAQHAADLAMELARHGHDVTVIAGRRAYGHRRLLFPAVETWEGVKILRVATIDLGKHSRWRRAFNSACFLGACAFRFRSSRRFDAIIAMTSPPLISTLAALLSRLQGGSLHLWVMDLNPDEAVAAGWLREGSPLTRVLQRLHRYGLERASRIIVLDRFMKQRIERLFTSASSLPSIVVVPPGARDQAVSYDELGRRAFRAHHSLTGKFVVMYSGNHSPCHPLDTLLAAAKRLGDDPRIAFCFVGGGSQFEHVAGFARANNLENITCLPYQPQEQLSASLSAADLHAVVMGDPFVGIVHPSKIYNILALGIPVLYVGPAESHITDLAPPEAEGGWFFPARYGEGDRVVRHILNAEACSRQGDPSELAVANRFKHDVILNQLCTVILGEKTTEPISVKAAGA